MVPITTYSTFNNIYTHCSRCINKRHVYLCGVLWICTVLCKFLLWSPCNFWLRSPCKSCLWPPFKFWLWSPFKFWLWSLQLALVLLDSSPPTQNHPKTDKKSPKSEITVTFLDGFEGASGWSRTRCTTGELERTTPSQAEHPCKRVSPAPSGRAPAPSTRHAEPAAPRAYRAR